MRFLLLLLLLSGTGVSLRAQITGIVTEGPGNKPMANVSIQNIHTRDGLTTDSTGKFTITAEKGQLIEFHKLGYKTARVRIPYGVLPPYFKIVMEQGAVELEEVEVRDRYRNFHNDSIRNYELFKRQLEFPKMTALDKMQHPFSALSKTNRQIWAFQEEYKYFEQQKYVDYAFNDRLITNLTGLTGDSVQAYMQAYRPTYEHLQAMSEYEFFSYIRETVDAWRRRH